MPAFLFLLLRPALIGPITWQIIAWSARSSVKKAG